MAEMISFNEFKNKLDLRVAKIIVVEDIPGKDKLYKMKIDLGELGERQIVAGIKQMYPKEQLEGKTIIVVANLAPATIAGIESKGMLLAVQDGNSIILLTTNKKARAGLKVE